ncbi:hypothetical protein BKA67DRAFT_535862 [Truncatella angustata]|uniref:Uncharacterized protein n=1 Tax=Truncatella angustata TaxID=152316 RepID=A0A9P8ZZ11_9PEZI|nr:uncharacterized protein BKA67DRAFT_535862 [Truncatella angustata]KAH6654545.1 hypothetical protein BKA67DRAFT_535862 [Truncatella angustata]
MDSTRMSPIAMPQAPAPAMVYGPEFAGVNFEQPTDRAGFVEANAADDDAATNGQLYAVAYVRASAVLSAAIAVAVAAAKEDKAMRMKPAATQPARYLVVTRSLKAHLFFPGVMAQFKKTLLLLMFIMACFLENSILDFIGGRISSA